MSVEYCSSNSLEFACPRQLQWSKKLKTPRQMLQESNQAFRKKSSHPGLPKEDPIYPKDTVKKLKKTTILKMNNFMPRKNSRPQSIIKKQNCHNSHQSLKKQKQIQVRFESSLVDNIIQAFKEKPQNIDTAASSQMTFLNTSNSSPSSSIKNLINLENNHPVNTQISIATCRTLKKELPHDKNRRVAKKTKKKQIPIIVQTKNQLEEENQNVNMLFKSISQRIEAENEIKQIKRQNSKCYYTRLKNSIEAQLAFTRQNKEDRNFIIEGCNIQRHTRKIKDNFKTCLAEKSRPKTALTRTGLQIKKSDKDNRKITRAVSANTSRTGLKELAFRSQQYNEKQFGEDQKNSQSKSIRMKQFDFCFTDRNRKQSKGFRTVSADLSYLVTPKNLERQKINQKLLNVILDCERHDDEFQNLYDGAKVFKYYIKKMNKGLQRASGAIDVALKTQNSDDNDPSY